MNGGRFLTAEQARRVYARIGRVQDLQSLYEHGATEELLAHAGFEHAQAVFELGYGTGAFAERVLTTFAIGSELVVAAAATRG